MVKREKKELLKLVRRKVKYVKRKKNFSRHIAWLFHSYWKWNINKNFE